MSCPAKWKVSSAKWCTELPGHNLGVTVLRDIQQWQKVYKAHSEEFSGMINNSIFRMIIFNFRTPPPACSVRWGLVIHWLPTVDNEAYFINPRFLSTSPPLSHWKIILVLSNFLTALSNTAWNLHSCNSQAGRQGQLLVKSINKGKHFLVLEDQVKSITLNTQPVNPWKIKYREIWAPFFIKILQYLWTSFKTIC